MIVSTCIILITLKLESNRTLMWQFALKVTNSGRNYAKIINVNQC